MTIGELKRILEEIEAEGELTDDSEVRFASQPNYPFEYDISDYIGVFEGRLYLGEGSQIGYLPGAVKEALGWRR